MTDKKTNISGLIGTIVFHGILIAILLFFSFSKTEYIYPDPEGIVVDFGELVQGEDVQTPEVEPTEEIPQPETQEAEASNTNNNVVTQDSEDAIEVKKTEEPSEEEVQKAKEEKERLEREAEEKKKLDSFFAKGKLTGKPGNSANGKESGTPGDPKATTKGNRRGTPGHPFGNGDVTSWAKPQNTQNCNKSIELTVKIDMYGNVTKITGIETALSEQTCIEAAKKAALKVKFPSESSSTETRYAKITYDYSTSR